MRTYYYYICESLNVNGSHRLLCLVVCSPGEQGKEWQREHGRDGEGKEWKWGKYSIPRYEIFKLNKRDSINIWDKTQSTGLQIPNAQIHALLISTVLPLNSLSTSSYSYLELTTANTILEKSCKADIWSHRQLQSSSSTFNTYPDDRHWCFLLETQADLLSPSKMCL